MANVAFASAPSHDNGMVSPAPVSPAAVSHTSVSHLAAIMHDLRTPLGGLRALAELLARTRLDDAQHQLLASLTATIDHLERLAGFALQAEAQSVGRSGGAATVLPALGNPDHAKSGSGQRGSDQPHWGLRDLVRHIAVAATARATLQGLHFRCRIGGFVPDNAAIEPASLRRAIDNLIDNAFKVTRRGTIRLSVAATRPDVATDGRVQLLVSVHDDGTGVGNANLLFQPYARVNPDMPGTGLGLHLVRSFAEAAGGSAGLRNRKRQGACAWFTLPLASAAPAKAIDSPQDPASDPRSGKAGEPEIRRPLALVVDDSAVGSRVLCTVLGHLGYETFTAPDGHSALDAASQGSLDLVCMDYHLVGQDGIATTMALREAGHRTRILAITGNTDPKVRERFLSAGADGFLAKPISVAKLADALGQLTRKSDAAA